MMEKLQYLYGEYWNVAQERVKEPCWSSSEPEHVVVSDKKKRNKKEKAYKRKDAQKIEDIPSFEKFYILTPRMVKKKT